jgi:hypothetical protein
MPGAHLASRSRSTPADRRVDRGPAIPDRKFRVQYLLSPDTEGVYALDVEDAASSEGALRVEPAANGQEKGIRWAADYELPA